MAGSKLDLMGPQDTGGSIPAKHARGPGSGGKRRAETASASLQGSESSIGRTTARPGTRPGLDQANYGRLMRKVHTLHHRSPGTRWSSISEDELPALFELFDIGQGLHRLLQSFEAGELPHPWGPVAKAISAGLAIRSLIAHPTIFPAAQPARCWNTQQANEARDELDRHGCTNIDFLFDARAKTELARIARILRLDVCGLKPDLKPGDLPQASRLFALVEEALASEQVRRVTGRGASTPRYRLALALQRLPPEGMCWHRDLEWPTESDAVTLIHNLKSDSPAKGGAFLYYSAADKKMRYIFRRRGQTTLIRNGEPRHERVFHAVSGYLTADTSRETMVIHSLP